VRPCRGLEEDEGMKGRGWYGARPAADEEGWEAPFWRSGAVRASYAALARVVMTPPTKSKFKRLLAVTKLSVGRTSFKGPPGGGGGEF